MFMLLSFLSLPKFGTFLEAILVGHIGVTDFKLGEFLFDEGIVGTGDAVRVWCALSFSLSLWLIGIAALFELSNASFKGHNLFLKVIHVKCTE